MTAPESQVIQLDDCGNAGSKLVVIQAHGLRITLTPDHNGVELSTDLANHPFSSDSEVLFSIMGGWA